MNIATPVQNPLIKQFNEIMPLAFGSAAVGTTGLVIVDEVNGFATVGAGYLAPPSPNAQVTRMIAETDRLAKAFTASQRPILAFLDTHVPARPSPPYPPHCESGTGEENLVPELTWLEKRSQRDPGAQGLYQRLRRRDHPQGNNRVVDW